MKFLCSQELGRLAKWLRVVGYDAVSVSGKIRIPELLALATSENRTILTRLKRLQKHRGTPVVYIHSGQIREQIEEVKRSAGIRPTTQHLFERCILCNVSVKPILKEKVRQRVPPYVFETQDSFSVCPSCKRIYWAATHYERAKKFIGLS